MCVGVVLSYVSVFPRPLVCTAGPRARCPSLLPLPWGRQRVIPARGGEANPGLVAIAAAAATATAAAGLETVAAVAAARLAAVALAIAAAASPSVSAPFARPPPLIWDAYA
jgi:hypothetical protein